MRVQPTGIASLAGAYRATRMFGLPGRSVMMVEGNSQIELFELHTERQRHASGNQHPVTITAAASAGTPHIENGYDPMHILQEGGPLASELVALVARIAAPLGPQGQNIVAQAEAAFVAPYSPTMLDVTVPQDASPVQLPDGPAPVRALVYVGDDLVGEVLLWIRSGYLVGLEQAWYTDSPPSEWPDPSRVRLS